MEFSLPLTKGKLLKRYKRFLADVELENGELVTAHCPNTGSMTGCAEAGWEVWLSPSTNPKRKLAYTWELVITDKQDWIGINTHRANALVLEAVESGVVAELQGYEAIKAEVKYGAENSRIDFLLTDPDKGKCFVEVKSVTLLDGNSGFFPDAKTTRGLKHLRELQQVVADGNRGVLLFCVQHTGIETVQVAEHIDPDYAKELKVAMENGVEVLCYGSAINSEKIYINQALIFNDDH
ncbi:DNA/RNA nuclease SfsA [Paraglaciecola sp. 2405UD69-4]|uniref:DNA/RNA nuclease SfsA n=1 Tax=Paraglaciecola sp. 2405UD69-4 TaxID=3391836 RepID=UPI0039C98C2D